MFKKTSHPEIERLRKEAISLVSDNNKIINKLWNIEQELLKNPSDKELLKQKQELSIKFQTEEYSKKITDLKEKIYELEINNFGQSDILSDSPGVNSLTPH